MATQTFYEQTAANRRNSVLLALTIVLLLGALGGGLSLIWGSDLPAAAAMALGAVLIGVTAALLSLYTGDRLVLRSASAHEVSAAEAPQLLNVVAELCIAANIPMPKVYVIDDTSPNAFATGRDPAHASIAITRGLLEKLDREELQGVIGHELSHVRNYDIRYSLMIGVMVGTVVLVADVLLRATAFGGRGKNNSGIVLLISLILAAVAAVLANLVKLAASRQREYLADASSVELTRNPAGLERALMVLADASPMAHANRATQHLFIVNPLKRRGGMGLFSTHPPLADRIERLRRLHGGAPLSDDERAKLERAH